MYVCINKHHFVGPHIVSSSTDYSCKVSHNSMVVAVGRKLNSIALLSFVHSTSSPSSSSLFVSKTCGNNKRRRLASGNMVIAISSTNDTDAFEFDGGGGSVGGGTRLRLRCRGRPSLERNDRSEE